LLANKGLTVIFIHHEPKSAGRKPEYASLRGAGDILAKCDIHLSLSHPRDKKDTILVKQLKNRDSDRLPNFEITVHRDKDKTWFEYLGELPKKPSKDELVEEVIFEHLKEHGRSALTDIVEALKPIAGETKVATVLNELTANYKLELFTGDRGKKYFDIPKEADNE